MKYLALLILLAGCASGPKITKYSSPWLRVMVDPDSVDAANLARIEEALFRSNKYFVVSRGAGFHAVVKEQDMVHKDAFERFDDPERYARLKKLYSVGAVVTASVSCGEKHTLFGKAYQHCLQVLNLVDASTGQIIASGAGESDDAMSFFGSIAIPASWDDTVEKLNDAIPRNYEPEHYDEPLKSYRAEVKAESQQDRIEKVKEGAK